MWSTKTAIETSMNQIKIMEEQIMEEQSTKNLQKSAESRPYLR